MNRIAIIQISDLQFGAKHRFGYPSYISKSLIVDINSQAHKYSFCPLFVVLSGDIAETGNGNEYEDAARELSELITNISVDRQNVLCVPGNHDINWELSKISSSVGNSALKLTNFDRFVDAMKCSQQAVKSGYSVLVDSRHGLQFILVNSCERETHEFHGGYVDPEKLVRSLEYLNTNYEGSLDNLRICVMHHRLDIKSGDPSTGISNQEEIEAILMNGKVSLLLTGHVHELDGRVIERDNHRLFVGGTGSCGVNLTQRGDGIQNQYSIFIIDSERKRIEVVNRAFNPALRTRNGLGGWVSDNTLEKQLYFDAPFMRSYSLTSEDSLQDGNLVEKLGIVSNPFSYNNAEKIPSEVILELFVSDEARHKEAKRLSGDAIIRGPRGAGKTMFLRFLNLYGRENFFECIQKRKTAECLPVFVRFSSIHRSDAEGDPQKVFEAADILIYDETLNTLEQISKTIGSVTFTDAIRRLKSRLDQGKRQPGTRISKLGAAIRETLSSYFKHVLLLLDEMATVFPREFFQDEKLGFVAWMNEIRNSGPYFTRVTVYPSDASDILNEERFGAAVNLVYNVRIIHEYRSFYEYSRQLVNRYLNQYSRNRSNPCTIDSIVSRSDRPEADGFEQIVYASDGSTRRLMAIIDKCLSKCAEDRNVGPAKPLSKDEVVSVIKSYATNLVSSYKENDRQLAEKIAKVCRKRVTYRFVAPGMSLDLQPLYGAKEESNIVKISDAGAGRRGTVYEFAYPYCLLNDIQTHYLSGTERVDYNRSVSTGEWISSTTRVERGEVEDAGDARITGVIVDFCDGLCEIAADGLVDRLLGDAPEAATIGARVRFQLKNGNAVNVTLS